MSIFKMHDILWTLFTFLGPLGNSLGDCCQAAYKLKRMLLAPQRLGARELSPAQTFFAERIRGLPAPSADANAASFCIFRAPPGFGKTVTVLAVAMPGGGAEPGRRWAVFAPPKAIYSWKGEIGKTFGHQVFGAPGGALILHAQEARHLNLFNARKGTAFEPGLVVASWHSRRVPELMAWADRFIVDEAHMAPAELLGALAEQRRWTLLVSAQRARLPELATPPHVSEIGGVGAEWLENRCPNIDLQHEQIPPHAKESKAFVSGEDRYTVVAENLEPYIRAAKAIFGRLGQDRVAIFLPDGRAGEHIGKAILPSLLRGGWKHMSFVKAVSKLAKFAKMRRAVLFVKHAQSEALNISASHLVVFRPDWVNVERYNQILCSVLRPTNPTERVKATLVFPRGVAAYRVAHYNAARDASVPESWWPAPQRKPHGLVFERPDAADLHRAACALALCNSQMLSALPTEVAAAMGGNLGAEAAPAVGLAESVFEAWRALPGKTLTSRQIRTMLGLDPVPEPEPVRVPPQGGAADLFATLACASCAREALPAGALAVSPADVDALLVELAGIAALAGSPADHR